MEKQVDLSHLKDTKHQWCAFIEMVKETDN